MKECQGRNRRIIGLIALSLLPALIGSGSAFGQGRDAGYVVKLGYYDCDHMAAAPIARDEGIYEKLGVKVEIFKGSTVLQAIAAGQMDVGHGNFFTVARASLKGSPAFVAADNHIGGAYYVVVGNHMKDDPKDLVGKKIAFGTAPEKNQPVVA